MLDAFLIDLKFKVVMNKKFCRNIHWLVSLFPFPSLFKHQKEERKERKQGKSNFNRGKTVLSFMKKLANKS